MTGPSITTRPRGGALAVLVVAAMVALAALTGRQPSSVYLLLAGGALGLVLLLRSPGLGLAALAALSFTLPLTIGTGTEVTLTPPVLLIPAVALAWLVDGLRGRSLRLPASATTLPLLLFVAAGLLSLLAGNAYWDPFVPRPGNLTLVQLAQWGIFALSALVFLLAGDLGRRGRWLEWATWTFLAVGAAVVLGLFVPALGKALGWSSSTMANRSLFWVWLAALATGQFVFNRQLSRPVRLGLVALVLAAAYVVWFMQKDWVSGWVPLSVAAVAVIWLRLWRRNRAAGAVLGLALVALAALLYPTLFQHAGGERELEASWGGRQALYGVVLDLASRHPILGLGPASYRAYGLTRPLSMGPGRAFYAAPLVSSHNNFIDVYAQMGLVGFGLFLWFLLELARTGWRLMPRFRGDFAEGYVYGALGGLAGTLVAMMLADWFLPFVYNIGFPGFRTSALAWVFLGGLVALEQGSGGAEGKRSGGAGERGG